LKWFENDLVCDIAAGNRLCKQTLRLFEIVFN